MAIRQLLRNSLPVAIMRWGNRLRFPYVFLLTAVVFVANLLIPDVIPMVDEILIGLVTIGLAKLKKPKDPAQDRPEPKSREKNR